MAVTFTDTHAASAYADTYSNLGNDANADADTVHPVLWRRRIQ